MSFIAKVRVYTNDPADPNSEPDILCAEATVEYDEHVKKRVVVERKFGGKVYFQLLADKMPLIAGRKSRVTWRWGPRPAWIKGWNPDGKSSRRGGGVARAGLMGAFMGLVLGHMDDD